MKFDNRVFLNGTKWNRRIFYCFAFFAVFLVACSDMGERDNVFDINGTTFENYWGLNDENDSRYSEESIIEESSSAIEYSSSSEDASQTNKESSSSMRLIIGGNNFSSSSMKIVDDNPVYSSSETLVVTGLGSCKPTKTPIEKGASTTWTFVPNSTKTVEYGMAFLKATYVWNFGNLADDGSGETITSGKVKYVESGKFGASVTVSVMNKSYEIEMETVICDSLQVNEDENLSSAIQTSSSSIAEISSSSVVEFSSSSESSWKCGENLVRDGVSYKTVAIKGRCWTKENLRYAPSTGNTMCFGNESENCVTYGLLYDYEAASLVCPSGWRLPTSDEYVDLQEYTGEDMYDAGAWFKASSGWTGENGNDALGFSALPGGKCDYAKSCGGLGERGYWWTATEVVKNTSHYTMFLNGDGSSFSAATKMDNEDYASVRCVQQSSKE